MSKVSISLAKQVEAYVEEEKQRIGLKIKRKKVTEENKIKRKKKKDSIIPQINVNQWIVFKRDCFNKQSTPSSNELKKFKLLQQKNKKQWDLHFAATEYIRKAMINSLLTKNWDALLKLLHIFIKLYNSYSGHPCNQFIRQMMQILCKCHPRIQGTEFEKQIQFTWEKYENQRKKQRNSLNVI